MPITQSYTSLLQAIQSALADPLGPLANEAQIDIIEDDVKFDLEASEQLIARISRSMPVALIADGGSEFDLNKAGGADYTEVIVTHVYYGVETGNAEKSLKGDDDGTPYWGEFQVRQFILDKLARHTFDVAGYSFGLEPAQRTVVPMKPDNRPVGKVMRKLTFTTELIHTPS